MSNVTCIVHSRAMRHVEASAKEETHIHAQSLNPEC